MKISQTVTELWSEQECLEKKKSKGHISETKKEEAIILVHDTSACQNTYSYNKHVISPAFSGSS